LPIVLSLFAKELVMIDHSRGARPFDDIDPDGPPPEDLPHAYLPDLDREVHDPDGWRDPGDCCQFTAGRTRCRSTRADHRRIWPQLAR
jgi:hypothetical protein